jgi:flagellar biosynthesis component FlhA
MNIITVILFVVALVLFVLCTLGTPSPPRFNLMAAGLAFVVLAILATTVHAQPTPQSLEDQRREDRAVRREQSYDLRDQRGYDSIEARRRAWEHRRWCREWRARVERHPRLILPRRCWR